MDFETPQTCCPDDIGPVYVYRFVIGNLEIKQVNDFLRGKMISGNQKLIEFKALSKRNGNDRRKSISSKSGEFDTKAARPIGRSILSALTPGDISPYKSPVRSAIYRAVTPGGVGGGRRGGSRPGQNRTHRCPEGYQYGGRFTDNRFTTCGAQLFDIPSILGIGLRIARQIAGGNASRTTGRVITGVPESDGIIVSRKPTIPRVGNPNTTSSLNAVNNLKKQIGKFNKSSNQSIRRMVRKDGFVLEPLVPYKVLRAIPDNRDMEGASMLMSALTPSDIGGEELGLLSNTGVTSLIYVLPGGSTLTLKKVRNLSVGERRKLGRVVNTATEISNSQDPANRLRYVSSEIGDGISYSEAFTGIKNPNSKTGNNVAWADKLFKNRKLEPVSKSKPIEKNIAPVKNKKLITNIDNALNHLSSGGGLNEIDPSILGEAIRRSSSISKQKLSDEITAIDANGIKYISYEKPKEFQHLSERFASDIQRYLGLEASEVLFSSKPAKSRSYLKQDGSSFIQGGNFNAQAKFQDIEMNDVARILISDFLSDQRERQKTSIYAIDTADGTRAVLAQSITSGLIDLSKIEITKRMKMNISEFQENIGLKYSEYYQSLQSEQRLLFIKFIAKMIQRAKSYDLKKFSDSLNKYGISPGEAIHVNILKKLYSARIEQLLSQKTNLRSLLGTGKI